jgi:hypothetical protein
MHKKSAYHNLIVELDFRHADASPISHGCDTGQICQVLHHFLSGLPEPPLEPTLFQVFFECCFLASRGESSAHCTTATARAKRGELSSGEVGRIKIARFLFCLMPDAHSDAVTYLLTAFTLLVRPFTRTVFQAQVEAVTTHNGGPKTSAYELWGHRKIIWVGYLRPT